MILFFWLVFGHCLADYPLQGQFLAMAKRRGGERSTPWQIALFAHSMIHAGFVAALTGSIALGLAELVVHMAIDYAKCEGFFGRPQLSPDIAKYDQLHFRPERRAFWIDQALHIACKLLWVVLV